MKRFTKIFVAVLAGAFALSCATDLTEDLGVKVDGGQTTEITLSLEESRTQLGEKAGNLYPLYWSEGDKISVNGVESAEAAISSSNPATATFTIDGSLATPYCIAYPAAPAGKVLFADQQTHAGNNSFGTGVSTMYAYGESAGVQLNHLTGVLKIGVTGSKTLVMAQISNVDRAPIAGAFDINFETGEVTATESSKEVITYNIPITADSEGLALSAEPQYIHVAVPAGTYDELYVTLYDDQGGVMYATVKADDNKPLAAGKVREFSNAIAYEPNAEVLVVKDKASLLNFASQAATLTKDVLFVADVDMTGEVWTPIEGYAGTINGNGYAIKGMTAPLFGTSSVSIKGLHLVDANIVTNDLPACGAFVCKATANDNVAPVIEHCSVSGSYTIENKNYVATTKDSKVEFLYGAIVGWSLGVDIKDCVNNATYTIKQVVNPATEVMTLALPGGIVGLVNAYTRTDKSKVYADIDGCINRGAITIHDTTQPEGAGKVAYWMGGIIGYVRAANVDGAYIANCVNDAPINVVDLNSFANQYTQIGGIVGNIEYLASNAYEISDCENTANGDISVSGAGGHMYIGGIAGYNYSCAHKNITNRGDMNISANFTNNLFVAGCLASPGLHDSEGKHKYTAEKVNNYGKITVTGSGTTLYVGGVMGRGSQGDLTDCHNYGEVTVTPVIEATTSINMGGFEAVGVGDGDAGTNTNCSNEAPVTLDVTGVKDLKTLLYAGYSGYCHHSLASCTNSGTVTLKGTANLTTKALLEDTTTDSNYNIGGLAGYKAAKGITNSTNTGKLVFDVDWKYDGTGDATTTPVAEVKDDAGTVTTPAVTAATNGAPIVFIGGMAGRTHQAIGATNLQSGKIIFNGSSDTFKGFIAIGGVTGVNIYSTEGFTNEGNIHVTGNHCRLHIGGCNGYIHRYSQKAILKNSTNSGNIYIGIDEKKSVVPTTFTVGPYIGGITGSALSSIQGCSNSGNIEWNASMTAEATSSPHIAGCIGYAQKVGSLAIDTTFSDLTNSGDITVKGDLGKCELKVGGIAGYVYASSTQNNLYNKGNIDIEITGGTGHHRVGGIAYGIRNAISDCVNDGNITIKGTFAKSLYVGGIVMNANGYARTNLTNNGDILVDAATINTDCFVGGMCYDLANGNITYSNCHNTGDITVTNKCHVKGSIALGGLIAKFATEKERKTFKACSNSGNVTSGAKNNGATRLGGLIGYQSAGTIMISEGFVNSGNVTHTGSTDGADAIYVAGVAGYISEAAAITYEASGVTNTWTGEIVNTGTMSIAGTSMGGKCYIAGIVGSLNTNSLPATAHYVNTGKLVLSGSTGSKNGVRGPLYMGGIVGLSTNSSVENAEVHCTIEAVEDGDLGMIFGTPRSETVVAKNCKIGGVIRTVSTYENSQGDTVTGLHDNPVITAENFHEHIYAGTTDWSGVTDYDGCSFLSVKPTI